MKDPLCLDPSRTEESYFRAGGDPEEVQDEGFPDGAADATALLSEQLGITHPYLLCDVEVYNRDLVFDLRDDVHKFAKRVWKEVAVGKDESIQEIDFPEVVKDHTRVDIRVELLAVGPL